jgi:hypothetical protein
MNKLVEFLKAKPRMALMLGVFLSIVLAWLSQPGSTKEVAPMETIDTYIPKGYVLIPIAVHNSESVDSIFGNHGIVDLYPITESGIPQKWPLARAVKMLRAPKNPNQFGVLVPSPAAARVMSSSHAFQVVIHNPKVRGTIFETQTFKVRRPIIVEDE